MTYQNTLFALADPRRREIFEALRSGPQAVATLAKHQPVSRPAVSQHLKVLETAGLVSCSAQGTRRIYRVSPEGLASLRQYIESFWQDTLHAFAEHIEAENTANTQKHEKD
jgi:DNA-binding transcriptional ArsR family regulator